MEKLRLRLVIKAKAYTGRSDEDLQEMSDMELMLECLEGMEDELGEKATKRYGSEGYEK